MKHDRVLGITTPEDDGQTPLDRNEADGLIPEWIATRGDLNVAEEKNIEEGMAWADRIIRRRNILSQEFLRELHARMFGDVWEWAGRYRDTERNIGVAPYLISSDVKNLLDDVRAWDEFNTYPLDERAARLHHRLTAIHPFPNGNGRCARAFADAYLARNNSRPFTWGGSLQRQARDRYIAALRAADGHDYGPLLGFVRSGPAE